MADAIETQSASCRKKPAFAGKPSEKGNRPAKRRAPKACQCCRTRKVRCNVIESGIPCMNCRLDEVECVITESKRKRRCIPRTEDDTIKQSKPVKRVQEKLSQPLKLVPSTSASIVSTDGNCGEGLYQHIPHTLYRTVSERITQGQNMDGPACRQSRLCDKTAQPPWMVPANTATSINSAFITGSPIPFWSKPPSSQIGSDELFYLWRKDVFTIPNPSLRNELFQAYIEFVHPAMPILDLTEFLKTMNALDSSRGKTSLLLFYAIMYAASAHVPESCIRKTGYASRSETRRGFLAKTKALYDMEYEPDRFIQVQSLLLLSSCLNDSDGKKGALYWTGTAINIAHAIGLDRVLDRSTIDVDQQRRSKILWWSLVILEHELALELRRLPRVHIHECEVPIPELEDFEETVSPQTECFMNTENSVEQALSSTSQRMMALICIQRVKLCFSIARTLALQFNRDPCQETMIDVNTPTTSSTKPGPGGDYLERVSSCRNHLYEWYEGLPAELQLDVNTRNSSLAAEKPFVVQSLWIHMVHFATLNVLHTPRISQGDLLPSPDSKWFDIFHQVVQLSSIRLADVASTLLYTNQVQHLPPSAVAILYRATAGHLQVVTTAEDHRRPTHLQSFAHCVRALCKLQESYPSAEQYLTLLETAARRGSTASDHTKYEYATDSAVTSLIAEAIRMDLVAPAQVSQMVTPPPDSEAGSHELMMPLMQEDETYHLDECTNLTPSSSYASAYGVSEEHPPEFDSYLNVGIEDVFDTINGIQDGNFGFEDSHGGFPDDCAVLGA